MKIKRGWRRGVALAEIMALLLLVLPTIAFIVTLLIDYWAVMRIDNNLKLITNMATAKLNNKTDLSMDPVEDLLEEKLSSFCPTGKNISFTGSRVSDGDGAGYISVSVSYTYNGAYLKDKSLVANMTTYSYHDQNATINLRCE